jgi:hypothetical protein
MSDCLICLLPIRQPWTPPTNCQCKPFIHERCWNSWIQHNGEPVCVICRKNHIPRPIIIIPIHNPPIRNHFGVVYTPWITMAFIIIILICIQFHTRKVPIFIPRVRLHLLNYHDEL